MLDREHSTIVGASKGNELADRGSQPSIPGGRTQALQVKRDRVRLTDRIAGEIAFSSGVGDKAASGVRETVAVLPAELYDVVPDFLTLSKTLGGGIPISATLTSAGSTS